MTRLDKWLVEKMGVGSRHKAKLLIEAGKVLVNNEPCLEAKQEIQEKDLVYVDADAMDHYVSRSAHKLLAAIDFFKVDISKKTCLDVGMSTGGFTQVLLERGASKVVGVEVGKNQLHPSLKNHPKVSYFEEVNARHPLPFDTRFDLIVIDLSFISVLKVLETMAKHLVAAGQMLILIKPQFEQTSEKKHLLLSESQAHSLAADCVNGILRAGWACSQLFLVPLKGKEGNQEFFVLCTHSS